VAGLEESNPALALKENPPGEFTPLALRTIKLSL
jgi:hypothetical protein